MSSYFEVTTVFFHSELKFNANFILLNYFHTLLLVFSRLSKPFFKKWGRGGGERFNNPKEKSYWVNWSEREVYIPWGYHQLYWKVKNSLCPVSVEWLWIQCSNTLAIEKRIIVKNARLENEQGTKMSVNADGGRLWFCTQILKNFTIILTKINCDLYHYVILSSNLHIAGDLSVLYMRQCPNRTITVSTEVYYWITSYPWA